MGLDKILHQIITSRGTDTNSDFKFFLEKQEKWFHGTNQEFDKFNNEKLGNSTQTIAGKLGHWFTSSEEEAFAYGEMSGKSQVNNRELYEKTIEDLLSEIKKLEKNGKWSLAEKKTQELEEFESHCMNETPSIIVKERYLFPKSLYIVDMTNKVALQGELEKIILQAKEEGYDGVKFENISDNPLSNTIKTTQIIIMNNDDIYSKEELEIVFNLKKELFESKKIVEEHSSNIPSSSTTLKAN